MSKIAILLLLCFSISGCNFLTSLIDPYPATISLEDIALVSNNSVGDEWTTEATVDGDTILAGESIIVDLSSAVTLKASATEEDTYPDIGSKTQKINKRDLPADGSLTVVLEVTVTEDRGMYAGNTAMWRFTFLIEPVLDDDSTASQP